MAVRRVFIGDPMDPDFDWCTARSTRALPRPISELPATERLWEALGRRFEAGHLGARRTLGEGWIGLVTRRELVELANEACAGRKEPVRADILQAVSVLDERTIYYLVARQEAAADQQAGDGPAASPSRTGTDGGPARLVLAASRKDK